jgi:hypothetical protein
MLVAKLNFWTLVSQNGDILFCEIVAEPTKFGCMPNELDQHLLREHLPMVVDSLILVTLQGDALQIGVLLKEHQVCSAMVAARGSGEPSHLLKVAVAVLLTVRSDRYRKPVKTRSKGIKIKLSEYVHVVVLDMVVANRNGIRDRLPLKCNERHWHPTCEGRLVESFKILFRGQ